MDSVAQFCVGIDASKKRLDVCIYPSKKAFGISNDAEGIDKLIRKICKKNVSQIVLEATGGYESLACKMLSSKGYKVWRVDPKRVKAFIASKGIHAKTDKIDAEMIALFASQNTRNYERTEPTDEEEKLRSLNKRRADLITINTEEKNRLKSPSELYCKEDIREHIDYIKNKIKLLDQQIADLIHQNDHWRELNAIVSSAPGIGAVTSAALIADMKELGKVNDKEISALAGLAPFIQQSGISKGFAKIKGGRWYVRSVLYMATVTAVRCNSTLKEFYERLRKRGKMFKVAIVAAMRKLLVILNAMVKSGEHWKMA